MIEKLKRLFGAPSEQADPAKTEEAIRMACLVMLIQTGRADHHLAEEELDAVRHYALTHFKLDQTMVDELILEAKATADHATSLYEFTSLINEHFNEGQKFEVVKSMWHVAYADGRIDRYEEHVIRRAADLLYVEHPRFIEAKLAAKPHDE